MTLTETGNTTGTFTGTLVTSNTSSITAENGTLEVDADGTLTATYNDSEDGTDTSQDTATITVSAGGGGSSGGSSGGGGGGGGGGGIIGLFGSIVETVTNIFTGDETSTSTTSEEVPDQASQIPITESIIDFFDPFIPDFNEPETPTVVLPTPEEFLAELPECNVFTCGWIIVPRNQIERFVFAPLPENLQVLTQKFPELGDTFVALGITRLRDVDKLQEASFTLPGLKDIVELPDEVVFATAGFGNNAKLIDFNLALDIDRLGNVTEHINVVSGKVVNLVIRPEYLARRVTGHLVLAQGGLLGEETTVSANSQLASLLFAENRIAQTIPAAPVIEDRLLLSSFEYTDADGDGIYETQFEAPLVHGEYEVITVIEYIDTELGTKEVRMLLVVDPEGYVYERLGNREVRIPGVLVSIFEGDPDTGESTLWPAEDFQQINPQTTNITGEYSFLVPPGEYYLTAKASGYEPFQSEVFVVQEGRGIHMNIELLDSRSFVSKIITPWSLVVIMLIIMSILLSYNFYRDNRSRVSR